MARAVQHPLLVVAHPDPDAFAFANAQAAIDGFAAAGLEVDVIDLYRDGFSAAMSCEEITAYDTDQPILNDQVADYAARVTAADTFVFIYPTWWSGPPATLKGFFDRVLVPGVGFGLHPRTKRVTPHLKGLRRIIGISTYGSPRSYVRLVNDNGRRTIVRSLRLASGFRARTTWLGLYGMDITTDADRSAFLSKIRLTTERLAGGASSNGDDALSSMTGPK